MSQPSDPLSRITVDPAVCGERPCIRGMRVRVSDVVAMVADGMTFDEILSEFAYLEAEDLRAALHYAALAVGHRVIRAA